MIGSRDDHRALVSDRAGEYTWRGNVRPAKLFAVARLRPYSGGVPERAPGVDRTRSGRERILTAAYDLFSRSGIRATGVDAITDEAEVAKMTLYRNFHSKNDLAVAFLALREERWFKGWVQAETHARATSPAGRLLAIFDLFTEWFKRDDFEGCSFVTSLLEFEYHGDPVRQACVEHLAGIRAYLCELATGAGVPEPERFAAQWHILIKGAIVSAHEGDRDGAMKARELGMLLLEREGLVEPASPIGPRG
jgi:AcrR family transcriptional regulator